TIHAVRQVEHLLEPLEPVLVNTVTSHATLIGGISNSLSGLHLCDGGIAAYGGFYRHFLGDTNYAYLRERNGSVLDIQEKKAYTNSRMHESASSGTYYFAMEQIIGDALSGGSRTKSGRARGVLRESCIQAHARAEPSCSCLYTSALHAVGNA